MRRRLLPDTPEGASRPHPHRKEVRLMQRERLEKLDNTRAELLLANRFRNFARGGLPPVLVLRTAAYPNVEMAVEAPEDAPETATAA